MTDTFSFDAPSTPNLVNFDGKKYLLAEKKENKTLDEYIYQYANAGTYLDRREAIEFALKNQSDPKAIGFLNTALQDRYYGLRSLALSRLDLKKDAVKSATEANIYKMATSDPKPTVRAKAISLLPNWNKPEYKTLYLKAVNDSSYSVAGEALDALGTIDSVTAMNEVKRLAAKPAKGKLASVISETLIRFGDESAYDVIVKNFTDLPLGQEKFEMLQPFADFLSKVKDPEKVKHGVDLIVEFRESVPQSFRSQTDPFINNLVLKGLATKKANSGLKDQADYINSKLEPKKGF
jgi:aminopeptidase N